MRVVTTEERREKAGVEAVQVEEWSLDRGEKVAKRDSWSRRAKGSQNLRRKGKPTAGGFLIRSVLPILNSF
jgi:hypothetical protein